MKKIELAQQWVKEHQAFFKCPVCAGSIDQVANQQIICVNGHTVDFNKHGYLYFLQKAVKTEYNSENLMARRRVLSAGLFRPIIAEVNNHLGDEPHRILDVGSGEGTPLYQLMQLRHDDQDAYLGFDISRPGVQLASQLDPKHLFFCLADLRDLPFADNTFSDLIEFFSPSDYEEFNRVLQPGGKIFKVIPGNDYLMELRDLLYPADSSHRQYDNSRVKELFFKHYPHVDDLTINYDFSLNQELATDLVAMSPLSWGKDARKLTADDLRSLKSVRVSVDILVGEKLKEN